MTVEQKTQLHEAFWRGDGSSLILIPAERNVLYDLNDYPRRFHDPAAMWESEMARARPIVDWPTDGLPTVRPNLGVTFVPAIAGLGFELREDSMPWPGPPLPEEAVCAASQADPEQAEVFRLAREFYGVHHESDETADIAAYLPDTQGVFDVAHLLRGHDIFYDLAEHDRAEAVTAMMDACFALYERTTLAIKKLLDEPPDKMIHGHGAEQGVLFSHAGARLAEDTALLVSPATIAGAILPVVERCADRFGGVFVHFCGRHETLLRQLCELPGVKAVDLGNPEMYPPADVLNCCAETDTVLHSRIAAEPGEDWRGYTERLARLVRQTEARVILRPVVVPGTRDECQEMLDLWHEETDQ